MNINSTIFLAVHRIGKKKGIFDIQSAHYKRALTFVDDLRQKREYEKPISYEAVYHLMESIPQSEDEHRVAWEIGRSMRTFDLGMLGYYLYSCSHMFFAYQKLVQHQFIISDTINVNLETRNKEVIWSLSTPFSYNLGNKRALRIMSIIDIVYRHNIVCNLLHKNFKPKQIEMLFPMQSKEGKGYLEAKLGCPIVVSPSGLSSITYWLDEINGYIPSYNPVLYHKLEPILIDTINQHSESIGNYSEIVKRLIMSNIGYFDFSFELVSMKLNMSPRNLQRQLKKENNSYIKLLEECRKSMVKVYIRRGLKNKEIASKLGYMETNSFIRAFKNWFGMSISAYRKEM